MKIAIITDGNNELGMGHIYQSITLANTLKSSGHGDLNIYFVTKSDQQVLDLFENNGYNYFCFSDDDKIFQHLKSDKPDRVIFDKLDVLPQLAQKIKEDLKIRLIIFTNLTDANKYADVAILADIGSDFENIYRKDELTGKVEFFGPKYWVLRPEFYKYRKLEPTKKETVENIMLIFGGADPCNMSSGVLNELLKMNTSFTISLVLGGAFEHHDELNKVISENESTTSIVKVFKRMTNVAEAMSNSDVVFASPGLSFFEALAVGTPVVGFHQNDLQRDVYKGFLKTYDKAEIFKTPSIIQSRLFVSPFDPYIKAMEIGQGKDEIINEIF